MTSHQKDRPWTTVTWGWNLRVKERLQSTLGLRSAGFLNINVINTTGQIFLCCGGCSVHGRLLGSIRDHYSLYASSTPPPTCDNNQNVSRYCPMSSWRENLLWVDNYWQESQLAFNFWEKHLKLEPQTV